MQPQDTVKANLQWNHRRWNSAETWTGDDNYGYAYHNPQASDLAVSAFSSCMDKRLRPYVAGYGLDIVEIGCGAGRLTNELARYARALRLLDINSECLKLCADRFKWFPSVEVYLLGDDADLSCLAGRPCDLIASYDAFVHIHPDIIERYVEQFAAHLKPGGRAWIDHSGRGVRQTGCRTAMTDTKMRTLVEAHGLRVMGQVFRNDWDCITIMEKPQ